MLKKAKWENFDRAFIRKTENAEYPKNKAEVVQLARRVRRGMVESCKESMPVKGKPRICARWWNEDLTKEKREVHRLRKKFQRLRKSRSEPTDMDTLTEGKSIIEKFIPREQKVGEILLRKRVLTPGAMPTN